MKVVVTLQALATAFFLADFVRQSVRDGTGSHQLIEEAFVLSLLAAVVMGAFHVSSLIMSAQREETAVALTRRAAADLIQLRFAQWKLTETEADVALFALRGRDVHAIAGFRGAGHRACVTHARVREGWGRFAVFSDRFVPRGADRPGCAKLSDRKTEFLK